MRPSAGVEKLNGPRNKVLLGEQFFEDQEISILPRISSARFCPRRGKAPDISYGKFIQGSLCEQRRLEGDYGYTYRRRLQPHGTFLMLPKDLTVSGSPWLKLRRQSSLGPIGKRRSHELLLGKQIHLERSKTLTSKEIKLLLKVHTATNLDKTTKDYPHLGSHLEQVSHLSSRDRQESSKRTIVQS